MTAAEAGRLGEQLAAQHYRQAGYQIREQNFRCRLGEVDLIAEKSGVLVFVEVKTRSAGALDRPGAWVDRNKQRKLMNTARQYLYIKQLGEPFLRFDVVEVTLEESGEHRLSVIENAFTA